MDKGHTQDEIRAMSIEWCNEFVFPERDSEGTLAFLSRLRKVDVASSGDPIEQVRYAMWIKGWKPYQIEQKIAELIAQRAELLNRSVDPSAKPRNRGAARKVARK